MMKNLKEILIKSCQSIAALTFIFSGFIKLNDPLGLTYKLEEYFAPHVLSLPWLVPYALPIALGLIFFEIFCGVSLLIGIHKRLILKCLLALTLFFAFLTFYSAYYNKVTECGCFGDAIPLTPWQSFYKDIVLLVLVLLSFLSLDKTYTLFTAGVRKVVLVVLLLFSFAIAIYVINALPLIDFRPYKIGTNIPLAMQIPLDAPKDVYRTVWLYRVDGEIKEFETSDNPWDIAGAEYVDRKTFLVEEGYRAAIHDFSMTDSQGVDVTDSVLKLEVTLLVLTPDVDKIDRLALSAIINLYKKTLVNKVSFLGLAPVPSQKIDTFRSRYALPYQVYFMDPTTIKTIVRGNPGLLLLKKGVVIKKWGGVLPSFEELSQFL